MAPPPPEADGPPAFTAVPQQSKAVSPAIALTFRGVTFIALLVSVIVNATNNEYTFTRYHTHTYMLACGAVGILYTTLQIGLTLSRMCTENQSGDDKRILIDFYGDQAISYLLATGAAAGFGRYTDLVRPYASASSLLLGFLFSAFSSVFSSFGDPK